MPILQSRKRYAFTSEMVMADPHGIARRFFAGDRCPDDLLDMLGPAQVKVMIANATIRDLDAKPAPPPKPQPARQLSVEEILEQAGWWRARVEDGQVVDGPRGYRITVIEDRPAREADLQPLAGPYPLREVPIVVSVVAGQLVATLPAARLFSRLQTAAAR